MPLPEHELERIGVLASRVLDGDASDAECADLARLRSEFPEVRELCADLDAGHAAFELGAGAAPLPSGFAQQLSFRAMRAGVPARVSTTRLALYWGAAAAGIAAAVAIWMSMDHGTGNGGTHSAPHDPTQSAKQDGRAVPDRDAADDSRRPDDVGSSGGGPGDGTDALFPKREQPRSSDAPAPQPRKAPPAAPDPVSRPIVVETPTLPPAGPSTQPDRELPPERPEQPLPATPAAVVVANFDQFDGSSLSVMQAGGEWASFGERDLPTATVTTGSSVRATAGYVSLALNQGGYAALDRGAEVGFDPATDAGDQLRVRVAAGRVFMDLDERSAAVMAECGIASVQLEPGSRVALDVSASEVGVAVLEGHAVVLGTQDGSEPKRIGRHASVKVSRTGRAGTVTQRSPRLRSHERRFLERRMQREGVEVFGKTSRWGTSGDAIERQAREMLGAGATPRELMPLLTATQKLGYEGAEALMVMRALHAAKKLGRDREETSQGLRRLLMHRHRGKDLEAALGQWLQNPDGGDRPEKAGRGQDGRPDKPRKPGKGGAAGKPPAKKPGKNGMAGPGTRR